MNKYDDINNFVNSESNVNVDYEYLINYINNFLYKNLNRDKLDESPKPQNP